MTGKKLLPSDNIHHYTITCTGISCPLSAATLREKKWLLREGTCATSQSNRGTFPLPERKVRGDPHNPSSFTTFREDIFVTHVSWTSKV